MTRVVAIQPALRVGDVDWNLGRVEELVRAAAREHAPDAIFLPEAMTSPNVYDRRMRRVARPLLGEPLQLLRRLAREYGCLVGGGFIAVRGGDARGTYALCEADGGVHLHDKDIPSFWEHNYYAPGAPGDDGRAATSLGEVGLACGWEWGRVQTIERLRGVRLLAGGMHFLSVPTWRLTRRWFADRDHHMLVQYAREIPGRAARMLGVPAVYPSHVGDFVMATPLVPRLKWRSTMVGETTICDADGVTLARMSYDDGEGYVCADVDTAAEPRPRDPAPPLFWNAPFPVSAHLVWHVGNAHGRLKYKAMKRLRMHVWQREPASGDLPAYADPAHVPPVEDKRDTVTTAG
jgi:predicted amidohydrolase